MVAPLQFGTKAETLARLDGVLRSARVLAQVTGAVRDLQAARAAFLEAVATQPWGGGPLIVRSSARSEDGAISSQAGAYTSVAGVVGGAALSRAIDTVIASYGAADGDDQVLVQPMLEHVRASGVVFSRDPSTGSAYVVANVDRSGLTDGVTSGRGADLATWYVKKPGRLGAGADPLLERLVALVSELEALFGTDAVDLEFAETTAGDLVLLQARPLTGVATPTLDDAALERALGLVERKVLALNQRHPHLHGGRTILGVMPDWNPAEIIGIRPRPLALSLYRELITDAIWAYQRDNYGYRNLRSFPLLVTLAGQPYVDVRVSFNSFIPADLAPDLAERLASYYLDRLSETPSDHDKVEFEIIYTCYTLDLPERLGRLREHGFSDADCDELTGALRRLTNKIIHGQKGLWRGDVAKIARLETRFAEVLATDLDDVAKIYWLIEDCKRYGTLPFAGLARAGFIAVQLLRSLVVAGVLTPEESGRFMGSLDTVSSSIGRDLATLSKSAFLDKYGHLRPGTYDLLSPRYDEAPDRYFDWDKAPPEPHAREPFSLTLPQLRKMDALLKEHAIDHDLLTLFDFIKGAIEGREYAKFVFTRSLSEVLSLLRRLGDRHGLDADTLSFTNIQTFLQSYPSSDDTGELLARSAQNGRAAHAVACAAVLPPLIEQPGHVWAFRLPPTDPNFVTRKHAVGPVRRTGDDKRDLPGSVLLIPSADPGYDWIFSHGIAAFVTMYGGVNSHMAIRAAELGIPAVIGAGQANFAAWSEAHTLEIDCENRRVRVLR